MGNPGSERGARVSPAERQQRIRLAADPETLAELLARLDTSEEGPSTREAEKRLQAFGPNELGSSRLSSKIVELLRSTANPLVVILLVAAVASAVVGEIGDAAIIGSIVFLSAGLNFWQTFRSGR